MENWNDFGTLVDFKFKVKSEIENIIELYLYDDDRDIYGSLTTSDRAIKLEILNIINSITPIKYLENDTQQVMIDYQTNPSAKEMKDGAMAVKSFLETKGYVLI